MSVQPAGQSVAPVDTVRVTIDGFEITVPKGTLIIRAAEMLGVQVPRFCDHPLLDPIGACQAVPGPRRGPAEATRFLHHDLHRRDGDQDPADFADRGEGAARHHGDAAGQPPARLPDVRQGRRVPAAEPGDVQRSRRDQVHRRQAEVPQADRAVRPGAAGPRALRSVRALHQVRRPDRRRPADRPDRARAARAGRGRRGRAVRLLLLRQHRADLPGGRADRGLVPVQGPALRHGLDTERLRALRGWVPAAHRPPSRRGHQKAGRQRARGERGVELRQGPLGLHLRDRSRPADRPAGQG